MGKFSWHLIFRTVFDKGRWRHANWSLEQEISSHKSSMVQVRPPKLAGREWFRHERLLSIATSVKSEWDVGKDFNNSATQDMKTNRYIKSLEQEVPPEPSLETVFQNADLVCKIHELLKGKAWDDGIEEGLRNLKLIYSSSLVAQVLRTDISIEIALKFFNWLRSDGSFKHDCYTYSVMINTLCRAGRFDELREVSEHIESMNLAIFCSLMVGFGRGGELEEALNLWKSMQDFGITPSPIAYTAILQCLVDTKQYKKAADVFRRMVQEEHFPNAQTLNIFLKQLIDTDKLEAASEIFRIMKIAKVANSFTFELMATVYAKGGQVEKARRLIDSIKEYGHRPSKRLLTAIKELQNEGRLEEGKLMVEPLESFWGGRIDVCPNIGLDLNAFVHAIHKWDHEKAQLLAERDLNWSCLFVYEILRRMRNAESAWSFFRWVKTRPGFSQHDSYTCIFMMRKALEKNKIRPRRDIRPDKMFDQMLQDCLRPSVPMFNMMIKYHVQSGTINKAVDYFKMIKEYDLNPNETSYSTMITGFVYICEGKRAMALFEEMQRAGLQPDADIYLELIICLVDARRYEHATSLFWKMQNNFIIGADEYGAIIRALDEVGNETLALSFYDEMRASGLHPTHKAYATLLKLLPRAKRFKEKKALEYNHNRYDRFDGHRKAFRENMLAMLHLFCDNVSDDAKGVE